MYARLYLMMLEALLLASPALAQNPQTCCYAKCINVSVHSTIYPSKANYDPADPLVVSGQVRDPQSVTDCYDGG